MARSIKPSTSPQPDSGLSNSANKRSLPVVTQESIGVKPLKINRASNRFLNPGEAEVIIALLRSVKPFSTMIEIGVNEGYTAKVILDNINFITYYVGIDVKPSYKFQSSVQQKEIPAKPGHVISERSNVHLFILPNGSFDYSFDNIVDAVFIDGDHGRKAVEHDSRVAIDCVRPGGIVIWHDYIADRGVDVKAVLDENRDKYDIKHVEGTWIAFLRVV